jgi:hypothetical protein
VDGHNRYEICKKNGISFSVQLMSFGSLQQVKEYMIDLQLGEETLLLSKYPILEDFVFK